MGGGTGPRGAMGKVLCLDDLQLPAVPSCRPKAGFFGNSLPVTPLSHPALTSAFRPQPTLCLGNDQLHVCMEQEPVCGQHLGPWLLCREWEWGGAAHTGPSHREVLDKNPWSPPLASSGTLLAWCATLCGAGLCTLGTHTLQASPSGTSVLGFIPTAPFTNGTRLESSL